MPLEICTNNHKFLLCVLYRAPNQDDSFWDLLQENLNFVQEKHNLKTMLIGDLNADPNTRQGTLLNDFTQANHLTQHIDKPARISKHSSTIIDQCITNFPNYIKNVEVLSPVSTNDHCTIAIKCLFRVRKARSYSRAMWDFKNADFNAFRSALDAADWDGCLSNDIDLSATQWTELFLRIARSTIPNKNVQIRPNDKSWYLGHLRQLSRQKLRRFNSAK